MMSGMFSNPSSLPSRVAQQAVYAGQNNQPGTGVQGIMGNVGNIAAQEARRRTQLQMNPTIAGGGTTPYSGKTLGG